MNTRFYRSIPTALILLASFNPQVAIARDKHAKSPCAQPREIVSAPHWSNEDQGKARKIRAQGLVNISVNEDGDVVDAKIVRASSPEAVDLLLAYARSAKFKTRTGCGTTHTAINYTLAND